VPELLAQARRHKKPATAAPPPPPSSTRGPKRTAPPPLPSSPPRARAPLPKPFDEPTRNVTESELLAKARAAPPSRSVPPPSSAAFEDMPTRMGEARLFDDGVIDDGLSTLVGDSLSDAPKFLNSATIPDPRDTYEGDGEGDATRHTNIKNLGNGARSQNPKRRDEDTRAVDIRTGDRAMSDVDWDID